MSAAIRVIPHILLFPGRPGRHPAQATASAGRPAFLFFLLAVEGSRPGLACFPDEGLRGFAGACPQGSGGLVPGERDLVPAQVADHFLWADRGPDVCPAASAAPSPLPGLLCSGQQQVQGGQDLMGELLERATPWVRDGSLKHKEDIVDGLENAPEAFLGMLDGKNFGKLLVPVS